MKKLLYILLIAPIFVFGQGWEQSYYGQGSTATEVLQTIDGGYITIGWGHSDFTNGHQNSFLIKTNPQGDVLWTKSISLSDTIGTSVSFHGGLTQANDGGYVISGKFSGVGFLMKLDDDGNQQWLQTYDEIVDMHLNASDGGYVILTSYGTMKTDSYGNKLWHNAFETPYFEKYAFAHTTDGGVVVVGRTSSWPALPILIKTDVFGNEEWSIFLSEENFDPTSVQLTSDGGFVISGYTTTVIDSYAEISEYGTHLIKVDEFGNQQWSKSYISGGALLDVQQTTDGGYISCGAFEEVEYEFQKIVLIKTDFNGTLQWYQTSINSDTLKGAASIKQTTDGGYIICGFIDEEDAPGNATRAFYLLKTNSEGVLTTNELIESNPNKTLLKTIDILGIDAVDKPFTPLIDIYDDGSSQKRIIIE